MNPAFRQACSSISRQLLGAGAETQAPSRSAASPPRCGSARQVGEIDAVASAAGSVPWRPLGELTADDIRGGLEGKAVSQIELVRQGARHLPAHASYTLVTGIPAREPLLTGSVAALVNGAVEAFVRAAAIELPGRQRINAVSPTVFEESLDAYGDTFAGCDAVPVARAANASVKSIEGHRTGQIFLVEQWSWGRSNLRTSRSVCHAPHGPGD
ncbi:SDR family oxidoreductase [Streptomyces sp. NRRL S-448]|uniref:SDR family oxidoreductase n=1 Tax=Streptomyces sp. NRRL S-448 TaxID=1463907 RepID=UPI003564AA84